MAEVSTGQAALQLGCSPDTIRRKVQRGELQGRRDARGRLWVTLPNATPAIAQNEPATHDYVPLQVLLAEVQVQRDALLVQLEQAAVERAELRRLLGNAQQQLAGLLPAPAQTVTTSPTLDATPAGGTATTTDTPRRRWRFWRRR